jgi:ferredoxin-type protein NapF
MNESTNQHSNSRRNFLHGNITNRVTTVRPPWAQQSPLFEEKCLQCNDCIDACPQNIIFRADDGYPYLAFSLNGCDFCAECLEICGTGALQGLRSDIDQAWQHRMQITDRCLSLGGIVCRTCGDHCEESAIKFSLLTQGRSLPEINPKTCTGCGQCIAICPTDAISIHHTPERSL